MPGDNSCLPARELEGDLAGYPAEWFQIVDFKGAFGEDHWIDGWTLLIQNR